MSKTNQTTSPFKELYNEIKSYDVNALRAFVYSNVEDILMSINYWRGRRRELIKPEDKPLLLIMEAEIIRLESFLLAKSQITMDFFQIESIPGVSEESATLNKLNDVSPSGEEGLPFETTEKKKRWGLKSLTAHIERMWSEKKDTEEFKENVYKILSQAIVDLGDNKTIEYKTEEELKKCFYLVTDKGYYLELLSLAKDETKIIQMKPDKLKLSDLADKCRALLTEGKEIEALDFATTYLSTGNYIPNKKHQKAEPYHTGRIKSWLDDIKKTVKKADTELGKTETTNPTSPATESSEQTAGAGQEIAANVNSTNKDGEPAQENTEDVQPGNDTSEEYERSRDLSVTMEHYLRLIEWFPKHGVELLDAFEQETIDELSTDEGRDKYGSVIIPGYIFTKKHFVTMYEALKKDKFDVIIVNTDEHEDEELDPNLFFNESITLTEEIQHIENLIKTSIELRGGVDVKPTNLTKIAEIAELFFKSRIGEYGTGTKEFMRTIENRPKLFLDTKTNAPDAKAFFSHLCYNEKGTSSMEPYREGEDAVMYRKVIDEIITLSKNEDFETKHLEKLVKKLKGKILMGKTSDGRSVVNKSYFYTTYHVLFFIDQIIESSKGESATAGKSSEKIPASTTPESTVSEKQTDTTDLQNVKTDKEKANEAIVLSIKNGGTVEDVMELPSCILLKNTEIKDPWANGNIKLNEDNYKKYITKRYEELKMEYKNSLEDYPVKDIISLASISYDEGKTVDEFVKENLDLIQKSDGTFLPIKGKVTDESGEVEIRIKSQEDFKKYIQSLYDLKGKLKENEETERKDNEEIIYEVSSIKSFLDLEETIKKMVIEKKVILPDLQKWAKENVLGKLFEDGNNEKGPIFSEKFPDNLNVFIEATTRKLYETPESLIEKNKKIDDFIKNNLKEETVGVLTFVHKIKDFCKECKFDYNLGDLRNRVVEFSKTLNTKMYDKYMADRKDQKSRGKTFDSPPPISTELTTLNKQPLMDKIKENNDDTDVMMDEISEKFMKAETEADIKTILKKYDLTKDIIPITKALKEIICDKKQISNMKLSETELNEWLVNFSKEKIESTESITPSKVGADEVFEKLSTAKEKVPFKEALTNIISKFKDSSEVREAIVKAIMSGDGSHTKKVAKGGVVEIHKMVKKAYENYADTQKE